MRDANLGRAQEPDGARAFMCALQRCTRQSVANNLLAVADEVIE
jgi:hypothetical protein